MRPVNLIPPEERRDKAAVRSGLLAYLLIGGLALVFIAVTMLVITNNRISERQDKVTELKGQVAATQAQATQYASFTNFAKVEKSRHATIRSLANSRFDWQRVLEEMARIIPGDVRLTKLSGAASAAASGSSGTTGTGVDTSSITGPSLDIQGCATSQDAVARYIAALRDIDGLTRVGLSKSDAPTANAAGSSDSASGDSGGCTAINFEVIAAFDAVPVPALAAAAPTTTTAAPAPTDGSSTDSSSTDSSSSTTTTPATTAPASDSGT